MSEPGFDVKRDGLGIGLFALGAFFAVLGGYAVYVAVNHGGTLADATGSGAIAQVWLASIGALPGIVFSAGVAFLGARIWLAGRSENLGRNLLAQAGLALAVAVLCGAFSPIAGGRFGFATGGLVAETIDPLVGKLTGLLAILAAIWFGWLRPARAERDEPAIVRNPDARMAPDADDGVSAAEAAALIPGDFHRDPQGDRKQVATRFKAPLAPAKAPVPPASPYPEDVRRRGEIPAGARPLAPNLHERTAPESASQPASVYRWTAPRTDEPVRSGADLAAVEQIEEAFGAEPEPEIVEPTFGEPSALSALSAAGRDDSTARVDDPALASLPQASWEQSHLFTEDEEPPVDAYGTPLELVEALRRSQQEVADAFAEEDLVHAVLETASVEIKDDGVPAIVIGEANVAIESAVDDKEGEVDLDEDETGLDEQDLEEDEIEAEDLEEDADGFEDEDELEEAAELEETEGEEDPELDLETPETAIQVEAEAVAPALLQVHSPGSTIAALEEDAVESEEQRELTPVAPPALRAMTAPAPVALDAPKPVAREREVVLQPQPTSAERATKTPAGTGSRSQMLAEAGCLFVERGRVAVSMLQRQYGIDFDDACKVLDELQELGLIGPYLGGQRRDILLSREQWLERVAKV